MQTIKDNVKVPQVLDSNIGKILMVELNVGSILSIWDKYMLQFETNTFSNLGQIHFEIWDKHILQFDSNIGKTLMVEPVVGSINDKADNFVQYCVCPPLLQPTIFERGI